jgi:hypothetical protein
MLFTKYKRKGQIQNLESLIMSLVIIGFLLIIGLALMGKARDTQVDTTRGNCGVNSSGGAGGTLLYYNCSTAYNSSITVINAMASIPDWLTVIVLAFIAVIVLGVIYMIRRNN